jgi:predicted aspartyl protease
MSTRALFAVALAACVPVVPVPITIGPNHELLVQVVVNGEDVVLQLDTGASTTTITPKVRDRLNLRRDEDPGPSGTGAAGAIAGIERAWFDKTEIADFTMGGLHVAVLDVGGGVSDGLLGMDVLHLSTIEIDLAKNQLELYPGGGDIRELTQDLVGIPYRQLAGGQIAIAINIDNRPATAILDVGANQSFANHLAAGARNDTARVVTETVGADGHAWRFSAFGDVALRIGGVSFVASSMLVGDLPIFAKLGLANGPAVIIGADLLAARHRVVFSTTTPPRAAPARLRLV